MKIYIYILYVEEPFHHLFWDVSKTRGSLIIIGDHQRQWWLWCQQVLELQITLHHKVSGWRNSYGTGCSFRHTSSDFCFFVCDQDVCVCVFSPASHQNHSMFAIIAITYQKSRTYLHLPRIAELHWTAPCTWARYHEPAQMQNHLVSDSCHPTYIRFASWNLQ